MGTLGFYHRRYAEGWHALASGWLVRTVCGGSGVGPDWSHAGLGVRCTEVERARSRFKPFSRQLSYAAFNSHCSPCSLIKPEQSVINKSGDHDRGSKQESIVPAKATVNPNPPHGQSYEENQEHSVR